MNDSKKLSREEIEEIAKKYEIKPSSSFDKHTTIMAIILIGLIAITIISLILIRAIKAGI